MLGAHFVHCLLQTTCSELNSTAYLQVKDSYQFKSIVMYELLYCSSARPNLTADDIDNILKKSQNFNLEHSITGCLLCFDKQFVQLLEGNKDDVKQLYEIIKKDKRHSNVILMNENDKQFRFFPTWEMKFIELSVADMSNVEKVLSANNFITTSELKYKQTKATKLFCEIAKLPFITITESFDESSI